MKRNPCQGKYLAKVFRGRGFVCLMYAVNILLLVLSAYKAFSTL